MAEKDDYLLNMLVDLGMVKQEALDAMMQEYESNPIPGAGIVDLMLSKGMIKSADVAQAKATHFGAEIVVLGDKEIRKDVIALVKPDIARKYRVIPVKAHPPELTGDSLTITVAISDPSDLDTIDSLHHLLRADIELTVASEEDIEAALAKYYPEPSASAKAA